MNKSFHEAYNGGHGKLATGSGGKVVHAMRAPGKFEEKVIVALREAIIETAAVANADKRIQSTVENQRGQIALIEKLRR